MTSSDGTSTRERVLDEALSSFAQRGYEATSLDDLASALGVRKQTILYYHPSKEALLVAVIDRGAAELAGTLTEALWGAADDPAERSARVVDAVLRLGAARPEFLALVREVVRLGPPHSKQLLVSLEPLLERASAIVPAERLVTVAAMVVGLATEVEVLRAAGAEPDLAWLRRRRRSVLAELE